MFETTDNQHHGMSRRPGRVAWLVLLALATLQFAVAQHASAHALDELTETCTLCVHLDDTAKAVDTVLPVAVAPAGETASFVSEGRIVTGRTELLADSRGPPTTS